MLPRRDEMARVNTHGLSLLLNVRFMESLRSGGSSIYAFLLTFYLYLGGFSEQSLHHCYAHTFVLIFPLYYMYIESLQYFTEPQSHIQHSVTRSVLPGIRELLCCIQLQQQLALEMPTTVSVSIFLFSHHSFLPLSNLFVYTCPYNNSIFKLASQNTNKLCILETLSDTIKMGMIDLALRGYFGLQLINFGKMKLVHMITFQHVELESPY